MPKVLGRYHIISELGRGGMGVVYKAVDPKLERFIAIKCLSDELSTDEITVTRFLREARNVAALNHPHIAQIFLADEDEGKPYFVMEFIDGESLVDRLARDGRLLPEQARRIITECAQALKAAHEENIVHRDIKPGNIMIDRRGRSVLTDFGIASVVHPDMEQTASKYIMGTPGYLPPEVMTGKPADHRGDLFALGAVYYEMLAGKRLVPGSGLEDTARTLLAADFPELSDLDETLDEKTFGVLGRMLAPDPAKRYQDYDDLLADLGFAAAAADAGVPPSVDVPTQVAEPASMPSASAQPPASAGPSEPAPTQAVDPTVVAAPTTQSATPPKSGSRAALAVFAVLVLVGLGASGFAVVKFAPAQIERVASMIGWSSEEPAEGSQVSAAGNRLTDAEPLAENGSLTNEPAMEPSADEGAVDEVTAPIDGPMGLVETDPMSDPIAADGVSATSTDAQSNSIETEQITASTSPESAVGSAASMRSSTASTTARESALNTDQPPVLEVAAVERPATRAIEAERPTVAPTRLLPPPEGVLVIGLGDAAITDPMMREIERALRDDGHDLVERGFVSGLAELTQSDEIDLNALSDLALEAGVRRVVVARALPAGQRELSFYGRSDTAYRVQADTIIYDLVDRRRLGSTEVEQFEYTGLNATQKARDMIAQHLAAIRADLGR
jgi:serine/threonine-protein kinase